MHEDSGGVVVVCRKIPDLRGDAGCVFVAFGFFVFLFHDFKKIFGVCFSSGAEVGAAEGWVQGPQDVP